MDITKSESCLSTEKGSAPPRHWTLFDKPVWTTFVHLGEVTEVRIPHYRGKLGGDYVRGTVSGYFDDHASFCQAVKAIPPTCHDGIYFTVQVIDSRLLARAYNRLKPSDLTTSDLNVLFYRWLPIDIDPVRPSGISSSDTELKAALTLRDTVSQWVISELKFPKPISAMSGNGGHLLPRLPDLPANKETHDFVKNTLEGLAKKFDTDRVKIDTIVHNPARIWKVYGSTARKGDQVPQGYKRDARPFRMAYIDDLGDV